VASSGYRAYQEKGTVTEAAEEKDLDARPRKEKVRDGNAESGETIRG